MKPDHARSEGARYERAAFRAFLRREITRYHAVHNEISAAVMQNTLNWVRARQSRYDKAPGGLGKTITEKKDTKIRRR